MAANGHDHLELVVLPLDDVDMRTTEGNNNNNNNNNTNLVFGVWDYLLNDVFYSATSRYEGIILRYQWRLIELLFLLKAVLLFILMVYVHMRLSPRSANYLDHLKDVWPRDGILRVEIILSSQSSHAEQTDAFNKLFTLENSYQREYKLKLMDKSEETAALFNRLTKTNSPEKKGEVDIEPSIEELVDNTFRETNTPKPNLFNYLSFKTYIYFEAEKKEMFGSTTKMNCHATSKSNFSIVEDSAQFCSTKILYPNSSIRSVLEIDSSLQSTSHKLPLIDDHELIFYENYIVEYSLEPKFLRMSPSARNRAGIPVMLVGLGCTQDKYFGDPVDQLFFYYSLISSVKSLSKYEQYKGMFRNVITEEYYRFVENSMGRMLYIPSFFTIYTFTALILAILKYSSHQTVYIKLVLRQIIVNGSFSAAEPGFIIEVLELACSWCIITLIMSLFFKDVETQCFFILIIWVGDKYLTKYSRCPITKRHWPKFFYLYLFSFYAYHYRFRGQITRLSLYCSWSFIEHSMIYFYRRYELPYVLQLVRPQ